MFKWTKEFENSLRIIRTSLLNFRMRTALIAAVSHTTHARTTPDLDFGFTYPAVHACDPKLIMI